MAKWEAEFNQMMTAEREDMDFTSQMEENYMNMAREDEAFDAPIQFDQDGIPQLDRYTFRGSCSWCLII